MKELQTRALTDEKPKTMNALDQSDAEESLAEWLDEAGVENSWKMAPTLAGIGLTQQTWIAPGMRSPAAPFQTR
jgi:hypothetical protein